MHRSTKKFQTSNDWSTKTKDMELTLCILPMLYAKLIANHSGTMGLLIQNIMKFIFYVLSYLTLPFYAIPHLKKRKLLPPIQNDLLLHSATEIARRIREKEVSSQEVVRIYIERCKAVNPILNAIVESRYDLATQEARSVDDFLARTKKKKDELARDMPLLGVPVTIKESIAVKGMSYSVGVLEKNPEKAKEDALVVSMIREAGAIILLVSNTPELCLFWESNNKVTGSTWNPYDSNRIAGGSSGGEAALLGSGASMVSLVSDVAGSARYPAMCCGVFGHKPTAYLVSCKGHKPNSTDKVWNDYFTLGVMTRYAEDLPLMMSLIAETEKGRRIFNKKVSMTSLKFFYLEDCCTATNAISRDTKQAIRRLKAYIELTYGAKVQKAPLSNMKYAFTMSSNLLLDMEVDDVKKEFDGSTLWKILVELFKYIFMSSRYSMGLLSYIMVKWVYRKFPQSLRDAMHEKRILLKKQFEDVLGDNGILIYPTFITPAHYRYQSYNRIANFTYMMIYNVLGLPVTQCPMGLADNGLPIGLQIVANSGNDHLTIAVAKEIEKTFGGWQQPPTTKVYSNKV
ncbi:fatty-acid amide hydrolase 2-B-like isoform X1 [Colletes latitarsis]|uniref:fatty-acid amide hydrolase 2-B-like isoform X1 n=2 Tax=Colletes latitarsis TaxID=2605962 RepID=UPI004035B2DF